MAYNYTKIFCLYVFFLFFTNYSALFKIYAVWIFIVVVRVHTDKFYQYHNFNYIANCFFAVVFYNFAIN